MNWNQYYDLDQINRWLDDVVKNYPTIVTSVVMGRSFEDREIRGIIIRYRPRSNGTTPLIGMLEGALHAREWITTATITWIIKEFLTSSNRDIRMLAENIEWHIFPVVNPDGYVYTFTTVNSNFILLNKINSLNLSIFLIFLLIITEDRGFER